MAHSLSSTLLIIGAGAHVPYGMPSGKQLRSQIKELYAYRSDINLTYPMVQGRAGNLKLQLLQTAKTSHLIEKCIISAENKPVRTQSDEEYKSWVNRFLKSFSESHVSSIDAYLATLKKDDDKVKSKIFKELGKLTVAIIISEFERETPLGVRDDDWIHLFIDQFLKKDPDLFFSRPPKIVTFNYDRIFERMLFTHLTEYHKYSGLKAKSAIESLGIVHVYGSLGDYSVWHDEDPPSNFLITAASNILVVGEDREDLEEVRKKIQLLFDKSSNVHFLGYGFDEDNNKFLRLGFGKYEWRENKNIYATSIGIKESDLNRINSTLGTTGMFSIRRSADPIGRVKHHIAEHNCMDLLSEIAPLTLS